MTIIYRLEAPETDSYDTRRILVDRLNNGSTDIVIIVGERGNPAVYTRHNLSSHESDKFGAAICKDMIDNYMEHNDHLKQLYEDSQSAIRGCIVEHNQHTHQLHARIEYLEAINRGLESDLSNIRVANTLHKEQGGERASELDDCKKAFFDLLERHNDLAATNRGLEQDVENLRIANALYRKRWSESESEPSESHGTEYDIRSRNFSRMVSGYRGMLSRNGKTITITLPFEDESVARNAEKYIVGLED